jgi:superfamily II DNA or RNA helicase
MILTLNKSSIADYRKFIAVKSLPVYRITGSQAWFPDEYATRLGIVPDAPIAVDYQPAPFLFDYQRDITRVALAKRKFAAFWDCGLGKTLLILEYAKAVLPTFAGEKGVLIVAPPMVCDQTIDEAQKFYGDALPIERVDSGKLSEWLATCGGKIGITNYEAFRNELPQGQLGALILDESSSLKSMYGKYAQGCIALGKGASFDVCR